MLVCLACYGDRVASLLETTTELRLYRVERGKAVACGQTPAPQGSVLTLVDLLSAAGADVLICGGLSGCAQSALRQSGVHIVPWIGGTADEVARGWASGGVLGLTPMRMPGCGTGECPGRRRGCRHGSMIKALRTRRQKQKSE